MRVATSAAIATSASKKALRLSPTSMGASADEVPLHAAPELAGLRLRAQLGDLLLQDSPDLGAQGVEHLLLGRLPCRPGPWLGGRDAHILAVPVVAGRGAELRQVRAAGHLAAG